MSNINIKNIKAKICIEEDGEGGYFCYCHGLPGVTATGDTQQETIDNYKECILAYIDMSYRHGFSIPNNDEFSVDFVEEKVSLSMLKTIKQDKVQSNGSQNCFDLCLQS